MKRIFGTALFLAGLSGALGALLFVGAALLMPSGPEGGLLRLLFSLAGVGAAMALGLLARLGRVLMTGPQRKSGLSPEQQQLLDSREYLAQMDKEPPPER